MTDARGTKPHSRGRATRSAVFFIVFLCIFCAGCSSNPDRGLLLDMFGLISEFYISAPNETEMLKDALTGFEKSLAVKAAKAQEKALEEKTGDDTTPEATPQVRRMNDSEDGGLPSEEPAKETPEEKPELKGPLSVRFEGGNAVLDYEGQTMAIALPAANKRKEIVNALLAGYRFAAEKSGGDPDKKLFYDALAYMTYRLDPHSGFLPPAQYGEVKAETSGEFGGVGIEVGIRGEILTVVSPIEGTPAGQAGLKPMDRIIRIDQKSTKGMSIHEAVELIRGEIGTTVVLTISRSAHDKEQTFDVPLTRSKIPVNTIKTEMLPGGIAWVRVFSFNLTTEKDLKDAMEKTEAKNGRMRGMILDLRNNPGGLLTQAIAVADQFLSSGMIVNTIGRGRLQEKETFSTGKGQYTAVPMIVLISAGSASGSEIVAGALQDHRRAVLVGSRSFGKGSVQSIFKMPERTGLRLTTALYYTPSGRSIQASGIIPDVYTRLADEEEEILSLYSESALEGHLQSDATREDQAAVIAPAHDVREYYKKTGEIIESDDYPEKGDWQLVFARHLLDGNDLSRGAILERARNLISKIEGK